jgi:restriction endonuclease S subunit
MTEVWKDSFLGEVFESITNGVNCDQKSNLGKHLVTRIETISKGAVDLERIGRADLNEKDLTKYRLIENDILFSHINSPIHVGKTALFDRKEEVYHGVNLLRLRTIKDVNPKFLRYFLLFLYTSGFWRTIAKQSVNQASVNQKDISAVLFSYPSLEKQAEIVEKIDSAFAEIDSLETNLKLSEDKTNQLLQSLLSAEYTLAGIPVVPLERLVDILDNQRIPINSTERLQRLGNVPYYGATGQVGTIDKAIFNETLILLGEDGVPFFDSTKHKAYEISGPSWVNNHAHVLRAKPEMVAQRYLLHFLNIFNYSGYVNGATRLKLTQGDMKRIPVPHPNMETQEKIVLKIDSAFEGIKNLTEQINQKKDFALALRQSLLNSAYTQEEAVA